MSGGAIIGAAFIGAASAAYSSKQAKKASEKAAKAREKAAKRNQDRINEINRNRRPDQESATVEFGAEDSGDSDGTYDDFLVNTSDKSKLGATGGSGVGTGAAPVTSLSMGI